MTAPRIDFYSTHPQYRDHMGPIWEALGDHRGEWYKDRRSAGVSKRLTVVSAFGNLIEIRKTGRKVAYMEHGAGFRYEGGGSPFAGGPDRAGVRLFLNQNQAVDRLNHAAHPDIPGTVVGTPKLDPIWSSADHIPAGDRPIVAFSFHWDYQKVPETRWAWPHYRHAIRRLAERADSLPFELLGHGHPRAQAVLRGQWRRMGIRYASQFDKVLEEADLYVVDTSSTAYEFAATDRPVLTLNAPWYRRDVHHGLRFWEAIPGLAVDSADALEESVLAALEDPPEYQRLRRDAVDRVYPIQDGTSADRAAVALINRAGELDAFDPLDE